jgi:hypothetical protein
VKVSVKVVNHENNKYEAGSRSWTKWDTVGQKQRFALLTFSQQLRLKFGTRIAGESNRLIAKNSASRTNGPKDCKCGYKKWPSGFQPDTPAVDDFFIR